MEYALVLIVAIAFGYFIYTRFKNANAERTFPPAPGKGIGEPNPKEQEK